MTDPNTAELLKEMSLKLLELEEKHEDRDEELKLIRGRQDINSGDEDDLPIMKRKKEDNNNDILKLFSNKKGIIIFIISMSFLYYFVVPYKR